MAAETLGFGEAAESITRATREYRAVFRKSNALGNQPAIDELGEVWEECRNPDWDGYGALPVEQTTLTAAYCILDTLPFGFRLPSIGAEPDGQLTLEWRTGPHRVLSVSVDPDGYLHYAGLFGPNKRYGTLALFSTVPSELLQLVQEL
jgi:hypothetical protein